MSIGMGLIGGFGDAAQRMGEQGQKTLAEQELEKQRQDAVAQREASLMRLKQTLADAPLLRLQSKAQSLIGEPVPQEAAPVTALSGAGAPVEAGRGLVGDPAALRRQYEAMPDSSPDKAPILAQLDAQLNADKARNQEAVAGKTRARTADESVTAAVEWAKVNDLPAVAAYEAAIGKPQREERRIDIGEKRADTADKRASTAEQQAESRASRDEARQASYDRKIDNQDAYQQRREERLDKLQEIQERRLTQQGDKAETQSQRASVTALMTSTERELERTMTLAKDPMLGAPEKQMFDQRLSFLQKDLTRYKKSLESFAAMTTDAKSYPAPTALALSRLAKNPDKRGDFDAMFGPGAADSALGSMTAPPAAPAPKPAALIGPAPAAGPSFSMNPERAALMEKIKDPEARLTAQEQAQARRWGLIE